MKVVWDSSLETQKGWYLTKAIRHHSNWNHLTSYYKSTLLPVKSFTKDTRLMRSGDNYYLVNCDEQVTKIPAYVALTIQGKESITYQIGPYIFFNNFEETIDGKYLISMLPYWFNRKPIVERKINMIMDYAAWWCRINEDTIDLMNQWVKEN